MQPVRALQQGRPVVVAAAGTGEGGIGAVVQDFAGALDGSRCQKVQPHASGCRLHGIGVDPVAAQFTGRRRTERVVRHHSGHPRAMAEPGQRNRDVGFGAAHAGLETRRLQ
jgi:hypothetical protein